MMKRLIAMLECAVLAGMLVCVSPLVSQEPAEAQWQVPNYSVPIGRGAGTGFKTLGPCATGGFPVWAGGSSADPVCSSALALGAGSILAQAAAGQSIDFNWRQLGNSQTVIKQDYFYGTDSGSADQQYAQSRVFINSATAGSESGGFDWYTTQSGASAQRMILLSGLRLGAPTGGDQGTGTINVSGNYYINGATATKIPITSNTTFYVASTGTNAADLMTCTSAGTPCLTRQYVFDTLKNDYRVDNGAVITIKLATGTLADTIETDGNIDGVYSYSQLVFQGNVAANGTCTRSSVVITPPTGRYSFGVRGTYMTIECMTLDHVATPQDFLTFSGGAIVALRHLEFKNNVNPWNVLSASDSGFLYLDGDLWINTNGQATFYLADNWAVYPTINNQKSEIQTGTLSSGSAIITGLSDTSSMLVGEYVRGTGTASGAFAEGTKITSIDSATQITVTSNSTVTGATSLTIGGLFVNYVGTRTVTVAQVFATTGAPVNFQAVEFRSCTSVSNCASAGTVTGQKGVVRSGAIVDFGATDPTTLPGTLPWYITGQVGSGLKSDATASVLEIPAVASGIISGELAFSRIRFSKYVASGGGFGASLDTTSTAEFATLGTGGFNFLGNDGAVNYGGIINNNTSANPSIALGIGTIAPNVNASTAGLHVYSDLAGGLAGIRLQNADPSSGGANQSEFLLFANAGYAQLRAASAKIQVSVSTFDWEFGTDGSLRIENIAAPSTAPAGYVYTWADSTDKVLKVKDDAGVVSVTVVPDTGAANQFLTAISAAGVISKAQPAFSNLSGQATLAQLPSIGTNTVLGNATAGTATPTALSVGSCSTAASALIWTTNTGFGCNTSITAAAVAVGGITGLGTGVATWLATPSSANLISAVTDETGTGALVFANTPTLVTPDIGAATGTSVSLSSTAPITFTGTSATIALNSGSGNNTLNVRTRGSGVTNFQNEAGETYFQIAPVATSGIVNFMQWVGNVTGQSPYVSAQGSDANVGMTFISKASGRVMFQTDASGDILFYAGSTIGTITSSGLAITGLVSATTSIKSSGATSGVGYATGAGGTVTQATDKSTAVTLNKVTGAITMNNAALAAATIVSFTLNNSAIVATDHIVASHESGGTTGAYTVNCRATGAGTAACDVRNNTAGSLSEAIVIRFSVIKSVNSWLLKRDLDPAANDNTPAFMENAA